ncbi:MAG TPA: hydrogenase subunit MbhD domain-containing protein [Rhodocyclaceae bacterium]|nr:hydrogenase subunit MbhD domain-containing protein [Rhodocyclaceae bacterium]
MTMAWIIVLMVVLMLASAVAALVLRNFLGAVAATSVVSLGVSVLFVLLRAPDVALTEAAVGAGLGGFLLALALQRLGLWRLEVQEAAGDAE